VKIRDLTAHLSYDSPMSFHYHFSRTGFNETLEGGAHILLGAYSVTQATKGQDREKSQR